MAHQMSTEGELICCGAINKNVEYIPVLPKWYWIFQIQNRQEDTLSELLERQTVVWPHIQGNENNLLDLNTPRSCISLPSLVPTNADISSIVAHTWRISDKIPKKYTMRCSRLKSNISGCVLAVAIQKEVNNLCLSGFAKEFRNNEWWVKSWSNRPLVNVWLVRRWRCERLRNVCWE